MLPDTIKLTCGSWSAEILPHTGANTVRLTWEGTDVLRPLCDLAELAENPFLHGSPILLPANRTDGAAFVFDGRRCLLPLNEPKLRNNLHGMLWSLPFSVLETAETSASLLYENRGDAYPFPFRLTVTVRLDGEGYHRAFEVENTGETDMPLTFALHTTFPESGYVQVPLAEAHRRNERLIPTHYGPLNETEKKVAAKVADVKEAKAAKSAGKVNLVFQSIMGGAVTPDQIVAKLPKETTDAYIKIEENKIYFVLKNGETGSVEIW